MGISSFEKLLLSYFRLENAWGKPVRVRLSNQARQRDLTSRTPVSSGQIRIVGCSLVASWVMVMSPLD
jgi:hypothetical protein